MRKTPATFGTQTHLKISQLFEHSRVGKCHTVGKRVYNNRSTSTLIAAQSSFSKLCS